MAEAETAFRESLAIRRKVAGDDDLKIAETLGFLAVILREQGKLTEAEAMFRDVLATQRKLRARRS